MTPETITVAKKTEELVYIIKLCKPLVMSLKGLNGIQVSYLSAYVFMFILNFREINSLQFKCNAFNTSLLFTIRPLFIGQDK